MAASKFELILGNNEDNFWKTKLVIDKNYIVFKAYFSIKRSIMWNSLTGCRENRYNMDEGSQLCLRIEEIGPVHTSSSSSC